MASLQGHAKCLYRDAQRAPVVTASLTRPGLGRATALPKRSLGVHPRLPQTRSSLLKRAPTCCQATASNGGLTGGGGAAGGTGGGSGGSSGSGGGGAGQPHPMQLWTYLYAAFLAVGGIMAYVKKGSTKSLTAAGGSGVILALAARNMVGPAARSSIFVALAISVALTIAMGSRYQRTRKLMPAGMAAVSSLAMSAGYLLTGF